MMKVLFGIIFLLLSFLAQGIEINADSFVEVEREEEEDAFELSAPNMGRIYTQEKVIIKRDLSALDSAVDSAIEDQNSKSQTPPTLEKNQNKRRPASLSRPLSADYDDIKIRWQRPAQ